MANSPQARKRAEQAVTRRERNVAQRSLVRTHIKKVQKAIAAGSEADARAVAWAEAKFKALGFDKVWKEPVTFPKWERRSEHAAVTGRSGACSFMLNVW